MTDPRRLRRFALPVTAWWMLLALALWLLGKALDQPASLAACAASAALLVAVGEAGDWLRRRITRRSARWRRGPSRPH
ncbi:hypothetical protein [Streptomyces sp. NPDC000410]|uniref:hypothetical protein n=1 Tax=Streptomyces sp. NPDC000410 TaxID=3154254 RepID=UPI00331CA8DC